MSEQKKFRIHHERKAVRSKRTELRYEVSTLFTVTIMDIQLYFMEPMNLIAVRSEYGFYRFNWKEYTGVSQNQKEIVLMKEAITDWADAKIISKSELHKVAQRALAKKGMDFMDHVLTEE